ncbi:uncharacterized protein CLUP02_08206 [Colletotrichum lupini]|uniref:Secreted protein n=1 Tax=Colletotrichum lupini TaxID=145971 RepID=A0A9Q8WGT5_9PEZI|nr:uncharacterized protein CLUP02_08206 [Colletotrichum lupini]UQC82716.1 hypothetical protein CLUP02_08206 [Colletotrichum lupini]
MRVTPGLFLACLVVLDGYTTYPCVGTRGGMACMSSSSATKSRLPRESEQWPLDALILSPSLWHSQVALCRSIFIPWLVGTSHSVPVSRLHAVGAAQFGDFKTWDS